VTWQRTTTAPNVAGSLWTFRIAYDDAYAKFSPGSILLFETLEHVRDQTGALSIDVYTDKNNKFFLGMLPERRSIAMLLIGTGGALDRSLVAALPTMTRLISVSTDVRQRLVRSSAPDKTTGKP
jgi:hypothetical protein